MDITNYLNNAIKFLPFIIVLCFVLYSIFATDVKSIIFLTGLLITTFITKIMLPFKGNAKQKKSSTTTKSEKVSTAEIETNTEIRKGNYNKNNGVESTSVFDSITSNIMNSNALAAIFGALSVSKNTPITKGGKKVIGGANGENCELLFLDSDKDGNGKPISEVPLCLVTMWFLLSYIFTIIGTENIWSENVGLIVLLLFISFGYTSWFTFISDCTDNFLSVNEGDLKKVIFAPIIIGLLGGFLWALYISAINITELKYFAGITKDERCSRPRRALYKCEFK